MSNILVADDSQVIRDLLKHRIEIMGHQPFFANDGEEAWAMIQEHSFDLVVLDQRMPKLDGESVLRKIRSESGLKNMPVVFFTAAKKLEDKERIFAMGVHDYLDKDMSSAEFEMRIKGIIEREEDLHVEFDANLREIFRRSFRNYKDLSEMFEVVLPAIANLLHMDCVTQGKVQDENYVIEQCFDLEGLLKPGQTFPLDKYFCHKVVETSAPVFISDTQSSKESALPERLQGIKSYIGVPLIIYGKIYGVLDASSTFPSDLDDFRIEIMHLFAQKICYEMEREIMQEEAAAAQHALIEARSLSSMSLLTASIAHEMRQPLTAADMDLADLTTELENEESRELASSARKRLKEALTIIRSMMKVYRGSNMSKPVEVDVNSELMDVILLFGRKTSGVDGVYDLTDNARIITCGNLSRIFVNLIGNALDELNHKGQLKITTKHSGEDLLVIIEDNGSGITKENLDKIFEAEFTTKKTGEGTGLGLWIAKKEIEQIGGTITVKSEVGDFTRFSVKIPRRISSSSDVHKFA